MSPNFLVSLIAFSLVVYTTATTVAIASSTTSVAAALMATVAVATAAMKAEREWLTKKFGLSMSFFG